MYIFYRKCLDVSIFILIFAAKMYRAPTADRCVDFVSM